MAVAAAPPAAVAGAAAAGLGAGTATAGTAAGGGKPLTRLVSHRRLTTSAPG